MLDETKQHALYGMASANPLSALVIAVREQHASRHDPIGKALMAHVRTLPSSERARILNDLSFFDQATMASLFARNVLEVSQRTDNTRAQTRAWRREAAGVASFVTHQSFSPLYLSRTQRTLDRFKESLRHDRAFFEIVRNWKALSVDEKDQAVLSRLRTMLDITNETSKVPMAMPVTVIADFSKSDGDQAGYLYNSEAKEHVLKCYFQNAPYGPLGRLGSCCHELRHARQTHDGLQPFDPAMMTQSDHNILHIAAHNLDYGLYLPYGIYGKHTYQRQPTEVEAFMDTDQMESFADEFYDTGAIPKPNYLPINIKQLVV